MRRKRDHFAPDRGASRDISAVRENDFHTFGMLVRYCPHELRLVTRLPIHIRVLIRQQLNDVRITAAKVVPLGPSFRARRSALIVYFWSFLSADPLCMAR
jgi:hypothetical protein